MNSGRARVFIFMGPQCGLAIMGVKWLTWCLYSVDTPRKVLVGLYGLPWRHGMGEGELTQWAASSLGKISKPQWIPPPARHIPECVTPLKGNKRDNEIRTNSAWEPCTNGHSVKNVLEYENPRLDASAQRHQFPKAFSELKAMPASVFAGLYCSPAAEPKSFLIPASSIGKKNRY